MESSWTDQLILTGSPDAVCLYLDRPVDRATLRELVAERQRRLADSGLAPGGSVALRLPPSLAYVVNLLAAWRIGVQVMLLDHRLTQHEVDGALSRLEPQFVIQPTQPPSGPLRAYFDVDEVILPYPGQPAGNDRALIQLSSGSTGPSKIIGRTAADLVAELDRYDRIKGFPGSGERAVVLASMVHVLGLVGGLLYGLRAGVQMVVPDRLTVASIFQTVQAGPEPTTLLGVPSQATLLAAIPEPPPMPQLVRMITGGEPVSEHLSRTFTERYGVQLGTMWGMTEVGVIATDISGEHGPALTPAPGMRVREEADELLIHTAQPPYVGAFDPGRWVDGWLHTRDAGTVDGTTGRVTVRGRLDSQVSVGGLKVDLTEVEQTLTALPEVDEAVVLFDRGIRAYVAVRDGVSGRDLMRMSGERLARYKQPQTFHLLPGIPRTITGKLLRDPTALRSAAERAESNT